MVESTRTWEEGPSLSGSLLRQWESPRAKRSEAGGEGFGPEGSFGQMELKVPVEIQEVMSLMCIELSKEAKVREIQSRVKARVPLVFLIHSILLTILWALVTCLKGWKGVEEVHALTRAHCMDRLYRGGEGYVLCGFHYLLIHLLPVELVHPGVETLSICGAVSVGAVRMFLS